MLIEKLKILSQYLIPHHALTHLLGWFANCECPWLKNWLIQSFIQYFKVDMSEAVEPNPKNYHTFNAFFTRAIKLEMRPVVKNINQIACPVDGFISQIGKIKNNQIFQAKGFNYSLEALLGGSTKLASQFHNGNFATLYLAPKNYHRIHMPFAGTLQEMLHVPGKLFSVNPTTVRHVPKLFARNERVATIFQTDIGPMALILIGAMVVGGIETRWAGQVTPTKFRSSSEWDYTSHHIKLNRADEMGRFKVGSTVIVLFAENCITWANSLGPENPVKMGQLLGTTNQL